MTFFSRSSSSGSKLALGQNVADDVERQSDVGAHDAGKIACPLDAGFGVEVAADVLDRLRDVARASFAGALERHVLQEVRQPVLAHAFVARAGGDEDADRRGLHMRRRVGDHREAGGQGGDSNAHAGARAF